MKVVLVVPNYRWNESDEHTYWSYPPNGLCCIAAMVEDLVPVEIIDAYDRRLSPEDLSAALDRSKPDIVGITVLVDQFAESGHRVARIAKEWNASVTVIMGGVYPTVNPGEAMADPHVDMIVVGEGEIVFREYIEHRLGHRERPARGLWFRKDGQVVKTGQADLIADLDTLPRPAYSLIPMENYISTPPREVSIGMPKVYPYMRMLTSRGCPYGCSFCQIEHIVGKKFRAQSPDRVLDDIAWVKETYGIRTLIFEDDNFFLDQKRVARILRGMIERDLVMPWIAADVAVFRLNEEILDLMKESGCFSAALAIESGNPRILKEVIGGKPVDPVQAGRMVTEAKKRGIYVAANFIVGFPTETWDEIRQTIRFAEEIQADYVRIFAAIPLRRTKLWDLCVQEKVFRKDYDHFHSRSSWSAGQIETTEFSPDDLTILRAYEWDRINFTSSEKRKKTAAVMNVTEEELLQMRRRTLREALGKIGK